MVEGVGSWGGVEGGFRGEGAGLDVRWPVEVRARDWVRGSSVMWRSL